MRKNKTYELENPRKLLRKKVDYVLKLVHNFSKNRRVVPTRYFEKWPRKKPSCDSSLISRFEDFSWNSRLKYYVQYWDALYIWREASVTQGKPWTSYLTSPICKMCHQTVTIFKFGPRENCQMQSACWKYKTLNWLTSELRKKRKVVVSVKRRQVGQIQQQFC